MSKAPRLRTPVPSDRLSAMAVFVRVVETGSFSRAARDLGIGQPTASRQVAGIEARYGLRLLQRTTRRVQPTEEGRAFYVQTKKLLLEFDELESNVKQSARTAGGKLRVSCPPALGRMVIAPLVFKYLAAHGDASIDLELSSRYLDPVDEGVDLAIRIGGQADSSHRMRLLAPSPRVLVASPDYIVRNGELHNPDELAGRDVLVYSYLAVPDVLQLRHRSRGTVRVRVAGRLRVNNSEVLMNAVTAGLGVACLPHWSVRDALAAGTLRRLLSTWEPEGTSIYALYPGGRRPSMRMRRFLDFLAAQMRSTLRSAVSLF